MKIKILVQEEIYKEVEITFPVYRANSEMFYYKIVDETNVTQITLNKHAACNGIENSKWLPDMAFKVGSIEITEQEYEAKFNECVELLTNLKNK